MDLLTKAGADVNHQDKKGLTAIMYAAAGGHVECLDLLIKSGADVNTSTRGDYTPLSCATMSGVTKIYSYNPGCNPCPDTQPVIPR